jgi:hypothetical protein
MNVQEIYVKCVIYHRGMAHHQVANRRRGLPDGEYSSEYTEQAVSRTADKLWSSNSGAGRRAYFDM